MSTRTAKSSRPRWLRWLIYYGLWPLEALAFAFERMVKVMRVIIIASNPVFLAYWLFRREEREREQDERHRRAQGD